MANPYLPSHQLIEALAFNLYGLLLETTSPVLAMIKARVEQPQLGDLVLEYTTLRQPNRDGLRLGRLDGVQRPLALLTVYQLTLPDGTQARWENGTFIALPTSFLGLLSGTFVSDPELVMAQPRHEIATPYLREVLQELATFSLDQDAPPGEASDEQWGSYFRGQAYAMVGLANKALRQLNEAEGKVEKEWGLLAP